MDATEEYELDYEAESPPRGRQPLPLSDSLSTKGENGEAPSGTEHPPEEQQIDCATREEQAVDSSVSSADESPVLVPSPSPSPLHQQLQRQRPVRTNKPPTTRVASLTRKLTHYKKRNAEMQQQLQKLYQNDAIAFVRLLKNEAQEKQQQIDALQIENRTLLHQQRVLTKRIEELQDAVENLPTKRIAQRDELRVCREQIRQFKETQKATETKATRLHQQVVDAASANKTLLEKVKQLEDEATTPSSSRAASNRSTTSLAPQEAEAVIASQENEITRLQHRIEVVKKAMRLEQTKHEKQASAAQEELVTARSHLETFHHDLVEKEKVIRSQFLEIKQLKRSLKDAITHLHVNQELYQSTNGRGVRFTNHLHKQSTVKLGTNSSTARDVLSRLGLHELTSFPSNASSVQIVGGATAPPRQQDANHLPRHLPYPPSRALGEKKPARNVRLHVQTTAASHSQKNGTDVLSPSALFYEDVDQETFALMPSDRTTNGSVLQQADTEPTDGRE